MTKKCLAVLAALAVLAPACGQEVKMVEVDPMKITFTKTTQSEKVTAKALDMRGAEVKGVSFVFESENPSIVSVTSDGLVKPVGNGSTAVLAKTQEGVTSEAFVSVCLPKELVCDPAEQLELKVGTSAPIKCHVIDCNDELVQSAKVAFKEADGALILNELDQQTVSQGHTTNPFVGLAVGDSQITVTSFEFEKIVKVHIGEQTFLPGMGPDSGGGGGGGGGGGKKGSDDPYGGGGRFDHILGNMKFN
jgi:hypothetical protein